MRALECVRLAMKGDQSLEAKRGQRGRNGVESLQQCSRARLIHGAAQGLAASSQRASHGA
jgi:hypothetical protein